jgi:hypothetical protein
MRCSYGTFRLLACSAMLLSLLELRAAITLGQVSSTPSTIANLSIVVVDPAGAVIPNAEITLKGETNVTTKTAQDGFIQVPLAYGSYVVTISRLGFKTTIITPFSVDAAKHPILKVVLEVAHDCDDCFQGREVPTTTSDVQSVIESPLVSQLPDGGGPFPLYRSVYTQSFRACSADKPCTQTRKFRVASVRRGCCTLVVTNGDGRGANEVRRYRVFLNGRQVLPDTGEREADVPVKLRQQNSVKVVLLGEASSELSVSIR